MKTLKFKIPLYKVTIDLIQIEDKNDIEPVKAYFKKNRIEPIEEVLDNIAEEAYDGGETYRLLSKLRMTVVFYRFSSDIEKANSYAHEKRHIEDRILEYFDVNDIESAAILAGYLGEKFYEFDRK